MSRFEHIKTQAEIDEERREQTAGPRMLGFVILAMGVFYGGIAYLLLG